MKLFNFLYYFVAARFFEHKALHNMHNAFYQKWLR